MRYVRLSCYMTRKQHIAELCQIKVSEVAWRFGCCNSVEQWTNFVVVVLLVAISCVCLFCQPFVNLCVLCVCVCVYLCFVVLNRCVPKLCSRFAYIGLRYLFVPDLVLGR